VLFAEDRGAYIGTVPSKKRAMRICEAYTRSMKVLQAFQVAAREDGFIEVEECGEGTVLWLRKQTKDTKTHQRLCIDSLLKSVTIYRTNVLGKIDSKTFRTVSGLQEWFALQPVR